MSEPAENAAGVAVTHALRGRGIGTFFDPAAEWSMVNERLELDVVEEDRGSRMRKMQTQVRKSDR